MSDTIKLINNYLQLGGLFNPELMDHEKVRDLILQSKEELTQLREALKEISINLSVCKNDYWFMSNLLENYSTDKQQAINDCVERMKLRKPIFNVLSKHKDLIDKTNKENER